MFDVMPLPWGTDCAEDSDMPAPAVALVGGIPMCPACMGALVGEGMPRTKPRTVIAMFPDDAA
jgi:hypothetical protein